ncbi:hypothetical protein HII31_13622 [Pseudocercospora fuligena]|uniref:Uncharacterized protein n=1 Tax=Pseudocercospora fuligena TaxID=685502 RepID=A0A8H6R5Y6_9PEZI|nr:hypothetical protein HII31_13622 [Pseudocercospora fuligena]
MSSFLAGLFKSAPQTPEFAPQFPYAIENNPYQCKRTWPPDFTQLSQKHQFRLERRYRRRAKLKWARPNWTKGVKLAQWGSIVFVCVYGVLYLDVGNGQTPFDGIRQAYKEQFAGHARARDRSADDASPAARQAS